MFRSFVKNLLKTTDFRVLVRYIANRTEPLEQTRSHIYNKTWNKNELIQYIKRNIVFENDNAIISSLPVGVALDKTKHYPDSPYVLQSEVDLNEIKFDLADALNQEKLYTVKIPKRNASGLAIFAKNKEGKLFFTSRFAADGSYTHNYLAVVLGRPEQTTVKKFALKNVPDGDQFRTEVVEKWNETKRQIKRKEMKVIGYRHEVIDSSELVSLVNVHVTVEKKDCVRHILASRYGSPVLGDYWNYNFFNSQLFGAPLLVNAKAPRENSVKLDPDLLSKLELKPGEEKLIPVHVHLFSLKLLLKKQKVFFVSTPPPESFVWTCNQLGLKEINKYLKV